MDPQALLPSTILSVVVAVGLAAACGFRVFVPLLIVSIATRAELLHLGEGFQWIGSLPAMISFGAATAIEVAAYYVPIVDNFLDTVATPAAVIAGTLISAAVITDVDPWLKWTLAVIAGGGAAAAVQLPSVLTRGVSTAASGGVGNSLVSTAEAAAASVFSATAILWPLLIPFLVLVLVVFFYRRMRKSAASGAA